MLNFFHISCQNPSESIEAGLVKLLDGKLTYLQYPVLFLLLFFRRESDPAHDEGKVSKALKRRLRQSVWEEFQVSFFFQFIVMSNFCDCLGGCDNTCMRGKFLSKNNILAHIEFLSIYSQSQCVSFNRLYLAFITAICFN